MKKENKENAMVEFEKAIKNAWTYERLNEKERNTFWNKVSIFNRNGHINGSFDQRWRILMAMYGCFLAGVGYDDTPNWRDAENVSF